MALLLILLALAASLVVLLFLFFKFIEWKHASYFRSMGVPYIGAGYSRLWNFMMGKISLVDVEMDIYRLVKETGSPVVGFSDAFVNPAYYVIDLDMTRNIYVKDFDHFMDRRSFGTSKTNKVFNKMLVAMEGHEWKGMRSRLSPTFTTGKIKRVFEIFERSGTRMSDYLENIVGPQGNDFDILLVFSKYAMDVIASCAFGIDSKSFNVPPHEHALFDQMGKKMQLSFKATTFIKFMFLLAAPKVGDMLGIEAFDPTPINYFSGVVKDVLTRRRKTGERQDDFLQLMMDAQEGLLKSDENSKETLEVMTGSDAGESSAFKDSTATNFDDEAIVSNCILFLLAGFDTLQSLLIFAAYQLAISQDVQEKLHDEVQESIEAHGKLTYEGVNQMSYLDMYINETLRLFPPAPRTERVCTKPYKVPGTNIVIQKGQIVGMPVVGVHHDSDHFEDPGRFDPDRFTTQNKSKRHAYSWAPFGHGPRNCIGMRFALMEVKAAIAILAHRFHVEPCSRTQIPMKFGNTTSLRPVGGTMFLKFTPRSG